MARVSSILLGRTWGWTLLVRWKIGRLPIIHRPKTEPMTDELATRDRSSGAGPNSFISLFFSSSALPAPFRIG